MPPKIKKLFTSVLTIFSILPVLINIPLASATGYAGCNNMTESDLKFFAKNNILYYCKGSSNCTQKQSSPFTGPKYNLTDLEIEQLARAAVNENGCNNEAIRTELSLMGNLYEEHKKDYSSVVEYVEKSGWFASSTVDKMKNGPTPSQESINAVKEVLVRGNYTLPPEVVEHDCIADIDGCVNSISNDDGKTWTQITSADKDQFISGKTLIQTISSRRNSDYNSYYVFYKFAGGASADSCGDPFGYYPSNPPQQTSASSASVINTDTPEGYIWNFFMGKGFSSQAIAGILGNAQQESGLSPTRHTSGSNYWGLFQWDTGGRWVRIQEAIKDAGLGKYLAEEYQVSGGDKKIPTEDLKKLLEIELKGAMNEDRSDWKGKIKSANSVDEATEIFLIYFEGAIATKPEQETEANKIIAYEPMKGKFYQGATARRQNAQKFYEKFSNGVSFCSNNSASGDPLYFIQEYIKAANEKIPASYQIPTSYELNKTVLKIPHSSGGSRCWKTAGCGWCTAMSAWFTNTFTDYTYGGGNGDQVVNNLVKKNPSLSSSTTPTAFSVFSDASHGLIHTGLVLSVESNGDFITIEMNADGQGGLRVQKYTKTNNGWNRKDGKLEDKMTFVDLSAGIKGEYQSILEN